MIRIMMVIESLRDGGKQRQVEELVRVLALKEGYVIAVVILKDEIHFDRMLHLPNVEIIHLKRSFKQDPSVFRSFYLQARKFKPDLIHSWGGLPSLVSLPYVILTGTPLVNEMVQNSRLPFLSKSWIRAKLSFMFSTVIIGNSRIGLKVYKVPSKKAVLIRNGMNTDRIHDLRDEKEVREHYDLPYDFKVVGMVATIDWRKNFRMFIRAALALLEVRRDVVFFVVGDGEDRKEIEDMVPEPFKKSNFVFTGRINNVEEVINIFNVAVLASYGEGTSNSILEYMMLKKPVVATDVYGINEVVKHGTNGYLVPQDDHMAMKDKINELLNNSVLSQKMGENGYQFVINECSIEKMVSLHEKLFGEVIKKRMPNNG